MTIKFVFSSVPMTTIVPPDSKSIPIAPPEHDHHYQVVFEEAQLKALVSQEDKRAIRKLFIAAASMALQDGEHDSAALYASVIGAGSSRPYFTFFDYVSNHEAVEGVVRDAISMAENEVV